MVELIVVVCLSVLVIGVLGTVAVALTWALRSALQQGQEITEKFAMLTMTTSEHYRDIRSREIDAMVAEAATVAAAAESKKRQAMVEPTIMTGTGDTPPGGW